MVKTVFAVSALVHAIQRAHEVWEPAARWYSGQSNSLVLRCASPLRLACAHERVHVQKVRDFPQTKLDSEIISPFLFYEHGDPDYFSRYLLRTYLMKKRSLIVEREIVPNWVYFGQGEDFKLTTELPEKVQYFHNQAIKNSLNEAILLMSINEALLSR